MNTRCIIAVKQRTHYDYIICYNQGHNFTGGVGPTLQTEYQSDEKIVELFAHGDLQTIHPLRPYRSKPQIHTSAEEIPLINTAIKIGASYLYVYQDGRWDSIEIIGPTDTRKSTH